MYNNFIQKSYSPIRNNAAEASTNDTINKRDFFIKGQWEVNKYGSKKK